MFIDLDSGGKNSAIFLAEESEHRSISKTCRNGDW